MKDLVLYAPNNGPNPKLTTFLVDNSYSFITRADKKTISEAKYILA